MTKEEAVKKIAELVAHAEDSIQEAEQIADEHNLSFDFSPAYGMGGTYNGGDGSDSSWLEEGWNPSSMSC